MLFRKPSVQNVSEWLEAATRKIAPPAQERIGQEIEAHNAESVTAHLLAGLSKNDAEAEALAELGDVREAARRFRRQHLTVRQATCLEASDKNSRSARLLAVHHVLFVMFAFHFSRIIPSYAARLPLLFLFLVALPTTAFYLARTKGGFPDGWFCVLIRCCNGRQLGMIFLFAFSVPTAVDLPNAGLHMAEFENWETMAVRLIFFIQLILALRLARKLNSLQNYPEKPASS
jgi:hypothetical protein